MGNQCSSTQLKQQFEAVKEFEHPSLGHIKLIRSIKTYNNQGGSGGGQGHTRIPVLGEDGAGYQIRDGEVIGVKEFCFPSLAEREDYLRAAKEAKSYIKIPTLLRLLSFQTSTPKSILPTHSLSNYRCSPSFPCTIYFTYYPQTLSQILHQKRQTLSQLLHSPATKKSPFHPLLTKSLKLNNYQLIDKLPHNERKLVNVYYQEVEILRFIDYVVGALYFLGHLEHRHQALCPENIAVDDQGKFALPDAVIFRLATNYEVAFAEVVDKNIGRATEPKANRSGLKYLSPQLLSNLKNKNISHNESSQKAQIFSVGLIALQMCLLDFNILESPSSQACQSMQNCPIPTPLLDRANLKLNKTYINKALIQAQSRYSLELVDLLALMLEYDPVKRINFSMLIDMLSPLLMDNLAKIQKLYNPNPTQNPQPPTITSHQQAQPSSNSHRQPQTATQLLNKLSQLQTNYQKVLNKTVIFEHSLIHDSQGNVLSGLDERKILEDQQRILKELRKVNVGLGVRGREKGGGDRERREVKGSQLYDIYLSEYETIKKNRFR